VHNSTYAYAENRPIDGIDLEGKEFWRMVAGIAQGNSSEANQGIVGIFLKLGDDTHEAMAASARLATGETDQTNGQAPPAVQGVINTANELNDYAASAMPAIDAVDATAQLASLVPIGEAGVPASMGMAAARDFSTAAFDSRINSADNFSLTAAPTQEISPAPLVSPQSNTPSFIVDQSGTAFPVPKGASGPEPNLNPAGIQTGVKFTGGSGGANGQVSTMRLMDPTPLEVPRQVIQMDISNT
jgi:hypothetical protein